MNVYFDTSAMVPVVIKEASSDACERLWRSADVVTSTRLLYAEGASAVNRAHRLGFTLERTRVLQLEYLNELWGVVEVIELGEELMRRAATYTGQFNLRGYDAVHCAAGAMVADDQTVLASGDTRLLAAWGELGFHTFDPNG